MIHWPEQLFLIKPRLLWAYILYMIDACHICTEAFKSSLTKLHLNMGHSLGKWNYFKLFLCCFGSSMSWLWLYIYIYMNILIFFLVGHANVWISALIPVLISQNEQPGENNQDTVTLRGFTPETDHIQTWLIHKKTSVATITMFYFLSASVERIRYNKFRQEKQSKCWPSKSAEKKLMMQLLAFKVAGLVLCIYL